MYFSITQDGKANEERYRDLIVQVETKEGIPAGLLHRLLYQESRFRSDIIGTYPNGDPVPMEKRTISSAGAKGIAQFIDATAGDFALDQWNPQASIRAAGAYLHRLYNQFGSWRLALAAYNAGPGNVKKYNGIPPFTETQKYVAEITSDVEVA